MRQKLALGGGSGGVVTYLILTDCCPLCASCIHRQSFYQFSFQVAKYVEAEAHVTSCPPPTVFRGFRCKRKKKGEKKKDVKKKKNVHDGRNIHKIVIGCELPIMFPPPPFGSFALDTRFQTVHCSVPLKRNGKKVFKKQCHKSSLSARLLTLHTRICTYSFKPRKTPLIFYTKEALFVVLFKLKDVCG